MAIIGAGMAGASLAAELAARGASSVVMLEGESHPGYHSTGRSAAFWQESYGGPGVQPLTTASGPPLEKLGFLHPRGGLHLARAQDQAELETFINDFTALGVTITPMDRAEIENLVPGLRAPWINGAMEPACRDIDVAGLHQHYLALARHGGAQLHCNARLAHAARQGPLWHLTLTDGRTLSAHTLINAAGAWADTVARLAGAAPLRITPYRRTMAQLRVGRTVQPTLPLVMDVHETFYFKPESGRLWLTPHDETPIAPCDVSPEEIDVAIAIARFETIVDWPVGHLEHKWAGLRSFAPDRLPVYGWDTATPALFWFAGQGGFGIQTAPAAAEMAARLVLGLPAGELDPAPFSPTRFLKT